MGCFNRAMVRCKCGSFIEFQSKAGDCISDYDLDEAPMAILADINGQHETCVECGNGVRVRVIALATKEFDN